MFNFTNLVIFSIIMLVLIGATQRKKLLMLFRSETNAVIKNATNNVKVLELQLQNLKDAINKMIDAAGSIHAQTLKSIKDLESMTENIDALRREAKLAKDKGDDIVAKSKLEAALYTQKSVDQLKVDLKMLEERKKKLEIQIIRMKLKRDNFSNQIEALKGRDAVNKALKSINGVNSLSGETLGDAIDLFDNKTSFESDKLDYIDSGQNEDFSGEIEDSFNKL